MSSRKGNIVPIMQLINSIQEKIKELYFSANNNFSEQEISFATKLIAQGAIKFGMNRMDPSTQVVFDMNEWLRLDGDSGPYIQYTGARIKSIKNKFSILNNSDNIRYDLLSVEEERQIMLLITRFNDTCVKVVETLKTNLLCEYLISLSRQFNSYYAKYKIIDNQNPDLSIARLQLSLSVLSILENGLGMLGIKIPDKM